MLWVTRKEKGASRAKGGRLFIECYPVAGFSLYEQPRNDLVKIVDLEVAKVIERVRAKDIKVHLDRSAVEFLIQDRPSSIARTYTVLDAGLYSFV
jgi:hypothetical protein